MASNGTEPYQYKLGANGEYQTEGTFSNLRAKDYTIHVMDAKGCTRTVKVTITQPTPISVSIVHKTDVSCMDGRDGSVEVEASGELGAAFHYRKGKNGIPQTSPIFDHLKAGTYKIYAMDDNSGCTGFISVNIADGPPCAGAVNNVAKSNDALSTNDFTIKVSPNPSVSEFTLILNGSVKENVEVKVTDMFGKAVYTTNGAADKLYRFGSELRAGVYILQVTQGTKSKTVKIIKQ